MNNFREMEKALQQEWKVISQNIIHRLIMACGAAHGGHTCYCDLECLSCLDELKLINDCRSVFVSCHYQSSVCCCSQQKIFIVQVIFSKWKNVLVMHFQLCSVYI